MYGIWLSKQTIGICATQRITSQILGTADDRCPNCLQGPERSCHLNRCIDPGRTRLFDSEVEELRLWMADTTDNELRYWLIHYLRLRGECTMCSLGDMSGSIKEIAQDIDLIGWVDIMHGRLPKSLHTYQNTYCRMRNSRRTGTDWMKQLTTKLLNISHSQWLYRNFSLHDKIKGHLQLSHRAAILEEAAKLATTRPEDIPDESRFLLEIDLFKP